MCCVRGPSSSTCKIARQGIDGQPEPEHLSGAAEPRPPFIQLEMREPEGAEEALMQGVGVLPSACQKG